MQHVHFIAIGGSILLDLAVAISKKNDYKVTVSGESLSDTTHNRLKVHGIAPDKTGWFPENITKHISAVVYGADTPENNPELVRARELRLKIFSSPEYIYVQTRNKTRIVVGGSYGKTTITAMILFVMKQLKVDADYVLGAQMEGFDTTVRLGYESRIAVFDGDESISSSIDKRPMFHQYKPHIAVLTGISHENSSTESDFDHYLGQFDQFINLMETQGRLIYFEGDTALRQLTSKLRRDIVAFPYTIPPYETENGIFYIRTRKGKKATKATKEVQLSCIQAALLACKQVGINENQFFSVIGNFSTDLLHK